MGVNNFILRILNIFYAKPMQEEPNTQQAFGKKQIAKHEAAHGIVWYLFRKYWKVNTLTIESDSLANTDMRGALHITANFTGEENAIQRTNELVAIAYAGLIGQNIDLIRNDELITMQVLRVADISTVLNTSGCGGDFEIANEYLDTLSNKHNVNRSSFVRYKLSDLISLFIDHHFVTVLHEELTNLLLTLGTIEREELISFFEKSGFADYIEEEALDTRFFHR